MRQVLRAPRSGVSWSRSSGSSARMARDHADVGGVALVAAAGPGEAISGTSIGRARAGCGDRPRAPAARAVAARTGGLPRRAASHVERAAVERHPRLQPRLVEQEGELPDRRRHGRAGRPRRWCRAPTRCRRGAISRANISSAALSVRHREAQHGFARRPWRAHAGRSAGLGAEHLDVRAAVSPASPCCANSSRVRSSMRLAGAPRLGARHRCRRW